jgi:hypothetical protein
MDGGDRRLGRARDRALDGVELGLIEPAQAGDRQRHATLGLGFRLHQGVGQGVAFEIPQRHRPGALILAPGFILGAGRHHVDIVHFLAVGDVDRDAVQAAQLIGAVAQGVEPQLAVQGEVLKRLGERVQPDALAHRLVILGALGGIQLG